MKQFENLVAICVVVCHYHKEVNYNYPGNMHDYQNEITQFWFPRPDYPCQESNNIKAVNRLINT